MSKQTFTIDEMGRVRVGSVRNQSYNICNNCTHRDTCAYRASINKVGFYFSPAVVDCASHQTESEDETSNGNK